MKSSTVVYISLFLAFLPSLMNAQGSQPAPLPFSQTTSGAVPEAPERLAKRTVAFITMHCRKGNTQVRAQGSGFFVSVPDSRLPSGAQFYYLVTNRHVAMCWDDDKNPMQVESVAIRLNRKDGSSSEFTQIGNLPWVLPTDDSVDLALLVGAPDASTYDYQLLSEDTFATDEQIKNGTVSEGLRIIFSGFFYQVPGLKQIEPIVREGVVAMIPDEDLQTTTGKLGKVYLGEVHAFHGNSGSPVLVNIARGFGYEYRLLGVVSGGYSEGDQNALVLETPLESKPGNSGIAVIVPVSALKALLDDPRVVASRDAVIARQHAKK